MARIVDAILIDDQCSNEPVELQERMPILPLRASREASLETTAPTCPSQMAASSFSKPGRAVPPPERPSSSSIAATSLQPSCRARSAKPY